MCGILESRYWIPDSSSVELGFRFPRKVFRIPKPRIPDSTRKIAGSPQSTSKNFTDSGIPETLRGTRLYWITKLPTIWLGSASGLANSWSAVSPLNVPSLKAIKFPTVSEIKIRLLNTKPLKGRGQKIKYTKLFLRVIREKIEARSCYWPNVTFLMITLLMNVRL